MNLAAELRAVGEGIREPACFKAADRIEQLEAEVLEQCRINGMGAEREAALMGKVERLEAENAALMEDAERWRLASTSHNFGISNWCEFGHRINYGQSAEKLIDAARGKP